MVSEGVIVLSLKGINGILRPRLVFRELEDSGRDNTDSIAEYVKRQLQGAWSVKSARLNESKGSGTNSWNQNNSTVLTGDGAEPVEFTTCR